MAIDTRTLQILLAVAVATILGLIAGVAVLSVDNGSSSDAGGKASSESSSPVADHDLNHEWCHKFNTDAYDGAGAWVPTLDMRKNFKAWDMEHGYWVGELTFLGDNKEPQESTTWPYKYDHYYGFLRVCLRGNEFIQRNIFVYPPQEQEFCDANNISDAPGGASCGVNGNEKLWEAGPLFADDCKGGMKGPYKTPYGNYITNTSIVGPNVVLYNVWYPSRGETEIDDQTILFQNQMTSFSNDGNSRFRTAQGLFPTKSLSYYTEDKVTKGVFMQKLAEARAGQSVRAEDLCKFDGYGAETGMSTEECDSFFEDFFEGCDE